LAAITLASITKILGLPPALGNLTLDHFSEALFSSPTTLRAIRNSLLLAVLAGLIITILGAVIGYLAERAKVKGGRAADALATFPFALPGTVIAAAVLLAYIRPIGPLTLFNTLWIIWLAYLMRYLAFGVRATTGPLSLMDRSLEEASRICGASSRTTFRRIVLPMLLPALFGGFFLVLIPTLRELTISVLLWSPGNETIGVVVFNLQEAGETQAAAAVAVLMLMLVGVINVAMRRLSGGRVGY
jgi:iron(III) transport system permease protein